MPDDTAVLDAPESVEFEEQAPLEETAAPEVPQTEGTDETPETDEAPQQFTPEEVEARLEEERARLKAEYDAEQERQRADAVAKYERDQFTQAQQKWQATRNGTANQRIQELTQWAYKQAEEGKELRLNPRVLAPIVEELSSFVFMEEWTALDTLSRQRLAQLAPEYRPPQEIANAMQQALFSQKPDRMVGAMLDYVWDAAKASVRDDVKRELAAEQSDAAKTTELKSAAEKRKAGGPRPTNVGGTGSPAGRGDLNSLDPKSDAYAREYERKYGFRP